MNVIIQMPDATYNELMANSKKRVAGSLVITGKDTGNFRPWNRKQQPADKKQIVKLLQSGKAVVTPSQYRVTMRVKREIGVEMPITTILEDFDEAREFLEGFHDLDFE